MRSVLRHYAAGCGRDAGGRWAVVSRTGGEKRRHALIEEAYPRVRPERYSGASLECIASACGIRKQTLPYYFPTKDALLEACLRAAGERVTEEHLVGARGQGDVLGPGGGRIHSVFRLAEEWPEFPMFIREASRLGPAAFEQLTGDLEALQHRAVRFLQEGMDAGEIRKQDPTFLLFQLYTAVVGSLTASVLRAIPRDKSRVRSAAASARSSPSSGALQPSTAEVRVLLRSAGSTTVRAAPAWARSPDPRRTGRPAVLRGHDPAYGGRGTGGPGDRGGRDEQRRRVALRAPPGVRAGRGRSTRLGRARGGSAVPIRADAGGSTRPCPTTSSRTRSARAGRCSALRRVTGSNATTNEMLAEHREISR